MRRLALAVLFVLAGCDGAAPLDAGAGDAGVVLAAPAPPVLTPCPDGWREVTSATGVVTCDPWPEGGYRGADCAWDEAHLAGTPGCARIGTACPADGWPADLPSDRPIVYVDDDAAPGGDGASRATAHRTIADATVLAPEGAVIAVATGRYDEAVLVFAGMTIWGACVSGTRIVTSAPSETEAALTLVEDGGGARNLGIDAPVREGIASAAGSGVSLEAIVIAGARASGLFVGGGSLTASDIVVRGTRERVSDGALGRGINVQDGAHISLSRALVEDNREYGLFVSRTGTSVEASDLVVRGTREATDGTSGHGVGVQGGAHLALSRALVENNREIGLVVSRTGTSVEATDVVVRGTRERASDGTGSRGVNVQEGAHLALSRALVENNRDVGLFVHGPGTSVEAEDVVVRGTRERASDRTSGRSVNVQEGAHLALSRALVEDNREAGLFVNGADTSIEASDLIVRDTMPRASDGAFGFGVWAQRGARLIVSGARIERSHMVGIASVTGASVEAREIVVDVVDPGRCPPGSCPGDSGGFGLVAAFGGALHASGFTVEGATLCGVLVGQDDPLGGPSALDLSRGVIDRSAVGACVQVDGYDTMRLRDRVEYRDVAIPLQATSYELPDLLP